MKREVVCCYCNECFQVDGKEDLITCPTCGCELPSGFSDWWQVYNEEIHKPLIKPGRGDKADRTHSRRRQLMMKLARERIKMRYQFIEPKIFKSF